MQMATTSKGLAPDERETLFQTLQGLIQNGDVPLEDLNTLVAELNQETKSNTLPDMTAAFHDSHLSDIFAAAEFGDFAAVEDDAGELEATEWPEESENPFPDDFIATDMDDTLFQDHSEKSHRPSRGRSTGNTRGRSRNTRSKSSSTAEDVLSSAAWEPFDSSFDLPTTPRKSPSKEEGMHPIKRRETPRENHVKEGSETPRCRTSSAQKKSTTGPDLESAIRTPTSNKPREKMRSLSRKKKVGEKSHHRQENDTKNLDVVLARMLHASAEKDNLTTSDDTATTSSETKATLAEEAPKKSPRRKVVKKVAAGIRADDVSTIRKAIESGMVETNATGKIMIRMAKPKKRTDPKSLANVLDAQKVHLGSTETRSVKSAPAQTTERLPAGSPRRPSRSRKTRADEELQRSERSKSQGRRHEML